MAALRKEFDMDLIFIFGLITVGTVLAVVGLVKYAVPAIRRKSNLTDTLRIKDDNIIAVGHSRYLTKFHCPVCGRKLTGKYASKVPGSRISHKSCACLTCKHEVTKYADGMMVAHRGKKLPTMNEIIGVTTGSPRVMPDKE